MGLISGMRAAVLRARAISEAISEKNHAFAAGAAVIAVTGDSELVIDQMKGTKRVLAPNLQVLHAVATGLHRSFLELGWEVQYSSVPREENTEADRAANQAFAPEIRHKEERLRHWQPNLCSNSTVSFRGCETPVKCLASNDVMSAFAGKEYLIDADFLLRSFPDGKERLSSLVPFGSEGPWPSDLIGPAADHPEYYAQVTLLQSKMNMTILGVLKDPLNLSVNLDSTTVRPPL